MRWKSSAGDSRPIQQTSSVYLLNSLYTTAFPNVSGFCRCSTLVDSALGDSAFGLWEGSNDHEESTEYLPSQRTLVTCDQEKSFIHSILDEEDFLKDEALSSSEHGQ